jgi:dipeptidyl-peptidase-3
MIAAPAATTDTTQGPSAPAAESFQVEAERFADVRVLRYRAPGFEALDLPTKKLLYYLYEAALAGREIIYDQKYAYNLAVRRTLEKIIRDYPGDRGTADFQALLVYAKRVWFASGIHHHYGHDKFAPGFAFEAFASFVKGTPGEFPTRPGQSLDDFLAELRAVMFDPTVDAKLVDKRAGIDVLAESAVNFYSGVTQAEVEAFYAARRKPDDATPVSYGLNSRLVRVDGALTEQVWKIGGLYTEAIEQIVYWLEQAEGVAENDAQRQALQKLIEYYESGDLEDWDEYNVAWVADSDSLVDTINGFIEVYNDPLGLRGSFEAVVSFRDAVATRRIETLAREAQWFEDHSPIMDEHKKADVTGITGKVITVVVESGDTSPATPVGINLRIPTDSCAARSKSVSLGNIVTAYNLVSDEDEKEFAWDAAEIARGEEFGDLLSDLRTDMHEVIGHASGKLNPGVGSVHDTLKNYGSTLEEARADLVALYYMLDPKLVELGLLPSVEAAYIGYDRFIRSGLMQQLYRIRPGAEIEEDHMRNRQLIAAWAYAQGFRQRHRAPRARRQNVLRDHGLCGAPRDIRAAAPRAAKDQVRRRLRGDSGARRDLWRQGRSRAACRGARALRASRYSAVCGIHQSAARARRGGRRDRRRAYRISGRFHGADARVRREVFVPSNLAVGATLGRDRRNLMPNLLAVDLIAAARPNFMKIAPLYHALSRETWCSPRIVHTGQHYDANMSDAFFTDLQLPRPHVHLGVGSGSHAEQTGNVMIAYEKICLEARPDWIVVVGDVNSTLACALVGAKLLIPVAHLEAGLRSGDRTMPEEINRIVTDSIADLLWTPSPDGDEHLRAAGVPAAKIERVGNIMIDSLELMRPKIEAAGMAAKLGLARGAFGVVTLHRPSNVDERAQLELIVDELIAVTARLPLVFPVHPRTKRRLHEFGLGARLAACAALRTVEPLSYIEFMSLVLGCRLAITDSGGIQEETSYLGIPCLTLRENTERPITVTQGTNRLVKPEELGVAVAHALDAKPRRPTIDLWDGKTAVRVAASLRRHAAA